jgi:hypothetical protein
MEEVAVRRMADRGHDVVGVAQRRVLGRAVHDRSTTIRRWHREFETVVDAPADECAAAPPGHDAAAVCGRQILEGHGLRATGERRASPAAELVARLVVEPEHVVAVRRDRASDRALRPVAHLAELRRARRRVERAHLESPVRVGEQHAPLAVARPRHRRPQQAP